MLQVVPFSPFAGLLEWVEQTIPLTDYLLGSNKTGGAHMRFRPNDWPFMQGFKKLMKAGPNKKLEVFNTVSTSAAFQILPSSCKLCIQLSLIRTEIPWHVLLCGKRSQIQSFQFVEYPM